VNKALSGVKIIDLTRAMAGPFCTMFLGDMGADVIKVESPEGDESRESYPRIEGISTMFMSANRNKRSITANLKDPGDVALIKELVTHADVIVENYRPGVMKRLGLSYEVLSEINPRLIYAACSGFGQTGPYAELPAYDIVIQAYGGLMSMTGPEGQGPTKAGFSFGDIGAGLFTITGILAALCERHESGLGQFVDVAMLDGQIAVSENAIARYLYDGELPEPIGNRHPSVAPDDSFAASDGTIVIAAGNEKLWQALCSALERDDLAEDVRFKTNDQRTQHQSELKAEMEKTLKWKTVSQWRAILKTAGVPSGSVYGYAEAVNDPEMQASGMIQNVAHPISGEVRMPGFPIRFSRTPCSIDRRPPLLGEHNEEVLQMLKDEYGFVNTHI
jgi:CoA:oxalate CoA-transferase